MSPGLDFPSPDGLKQNHALLDVFDPLPANAFPFVRALIHDETTPELTQDLFRADSPFDTVHWNAPELNADMTAKYSLVTALRQDT